jgi:GH24 family phage-related lysozyme (muramidase)
VNKPRLVIAALSLSAAGFVAIVVDEGYTDRAVVPTKNDRPTVGFGSTFRDDGSPVQMGDTITPPKAVARSAAHIARDEAGLKACVTGPMTQGEYDVLVSFAYQYGAPATCRSSMVRHINAGRYAESCEAYLLYRFSGGYDCSVPGNRICAGVWKRNVERRAKCLESSEISPQLR